MPAVAITDHGGLFGAVAFFLECKEAGIKPILGFEAYVAPYSRKDMMSSSYSHLVLLAKNNVGWKNLMRLSSIGYLEGFSNRPRIDMEVLRRYSDGIIATSACVAGAIPQAILRGDIDKARKLTEEHIDIFGKENFYFELQDDGTPEVRAASEGLIKLGREMGVPFIVTNDTHYLNTDDALSHEILLCIKTHTTMDDPNRMRFGNGQIYFKSPEEMAKLFPDVPEAITNTLEIAERCNVDIAADPQLPSVKIPDGFKDPADYLSYLARNGLKERYESATPELEARLEYELGVINKMNFAGYFLIIHDLVRKAKEMDVTVRCRGAAAGSLAVYSIGITDVDPIKFDLVFECFLNPERISMPNIEIDIADRDMGKLIDYLVEKYGWDAVCRTVRFSSMTARYVVESVARVNGFSKSEIDTISALITDDMLKTAAMTESIADMSVLDMSILRNSAVLEGLIHDNNSYKNIFRHAAVLENLKHCLFALPDRVIIAPGEVVNWAPIFKVPFLPSDQIMTQFDMNHIEKIGLVKMDFLGLRSLTIVQDTQRLVKKNHGIDIDLCNLPDDDQKTLDLFGNGDTTGIFQFEADDIKDYLRKLKPSGMEDLMAMTALYRPKNKDHIDMFIDRKHGREKIEYLHPCLEKILGVTYGVIVYREQVMRIAQVMGKFTMGQADILYHAIRKKQTSEMEETGGKFIDGAVSQGIDKTVAKEVYDLLVKFAGYTFLRAQAVTYTYLSYQEAYLKAHYPSEYITAYIGAYHEDKGNVLRMKNEAERMGISLQKP
jgi:DNA polymerase-3 subunit alpha